MPLTSLSRSNASHETLHRIVILAVVIALLVMVSKIHYLWFHTTAEFMSAVIGITLYAIASSSFPFHKNAFLLFISQAFFWSACLDITHAMVFPGMGPGDGDFNLAPQLWIGARGIEAIALLLSPLFLQRPLPHKATFWLIGAVAISWGAAVFTGLLPPFFIEHVGLTTLKKNCEYAIITTLLIAAYSIYRQRKLLPPGIGRLIFGVISLTIATEFCFTIYVSMYDISNLLGHIFKVVSYWLMLRVILITMIDQPFRVMSQDAYSFDAIPLPVLVLDPQGVIRSSNESARSHTPAGGIGQSLQSVWLSDAASGPVSQAIAEGKSFRGDIAAEKENRWYHVVLRPVGHNNQLPLGFVCVFNDITERRLSEFALTAAKDQLTHKNRELERFTEILAHHLQEPVRLQHIFAQRLSSLLPPPVAPEVQEAINIIANGSLHQRNLLRDAQRYLAINGEETAPHSCNIAAILDRTLAHQTEKTDWLTVEMADLPAVAICPSRLADIFSALLENTAAYRSPQRPLQATLAAKTRDQSVLVTLTDNGIGIPPEFRQRVFRIFEQLHPDQSPGTGIGLALCQKILETVGGSIWIESAEPVGTKICFLLPLAGASPVTPSPTPL